MFISASYTDDLSGVRLKMKLEVFVSLVTILCVEGKPHKSVAGNKLLLISFDGFRWDYDQDVDTPNLDQLVVDGVKAPYITPPMLTMTAPSHFTTITGNKKLYCFYCCVDVII